MPSWCPEDPRPETRGGNSSPTRRAQSSEDHHRCYSPCARLAGAQLARRPSHTSHRSPRRLDLRPHAADEDAVGRGRQSSAAGRGAAMEKGDACPPAPDSGTRPTAMPRDFLSASHGKPPPPPAFYSVRTRPAQPSSTHQPWEKPGRRGPWESRAVKPRPSAVPGARRGPRSPRGHTALGDLLPNPRRPGRPP